MMKKEVPRTLPSAASSADCRQSPARHVSTAVHGTRTVLLDSRGGRFYGLDDVGARIWALAREGRTAEQIVETLTEEYDVDRETAAADVRNLLDELRSKRLLENE